MIWLAIAAAGALGAVCRYLVDHLVTARVAGVFPWGTLLINVTGSGLAGAVAGWVSGAGAAELNLVVAGGFLGAYTTFSTAMYETVRLAEERRHRAAAANLVVPLVASVAAAGIGWLVTGG